MTVCNAGFLVIFVSFIIPLGISIGSYLLFWKKRLNETNMQKVLAVVLTLAVLFVFVVLGLYASIEYGLACIDSGVLLK